MGLHIYGKFGIFVVILAMLEFEWVCVGGDWVVADLSRPYLLVYSTLGTHAELVWWVADLSRPYLLVYSTLGTPAEVVWCGWLLRLQ